jgi:hypothetical protein
MTYCVTGYAIGATLTSKPTYGTPIAHQHVAIPSSLYVANTYKHVEDIYKIIREA